ncbi:hypothetical protein TWF718_003939 [Orbilia javanica]|uniref:Uncharacterized protein n=1 Tax=Orbilia javanica TaxID=47235 RepID=A0AAN8NZ02_9PEZI
MESFTKYVEGLNKNWVNESTCGIREFELYEVLEKLAKRPTSLILFKRYQRANARSEDCQKSLWRKLSLGFIRLGRFRRERQQVTCHDVTKKRNDFASWELYNEQIGVLSRSMMRVYNKIDAWICRYNMNDRGLAYYTLFLREAKGDIDGPLLNSDGLVELVWGKGITRSVLESLLKEVTPNIGKNAEALIAKLTERAAATKSAMQIFGKKKKTQGEKDKVLEFCLKSVGSIPDPPGSRGT